VACERCPRLRRWCREVARTKVKRFRDQDYWGRPVPGFGDPAARLLVVGLAPAAHGGNRTGRVFTGDRSGDFLFAGLHRAGFASQPQSVARDDGLRLRDCYVTPVARCAPPANKPTAAEIARCREYLARERALLPNLRAVLVLGRIAMDGWLAMLRETEGPLPRRPAFAHGASHDLGHGLRLFCSYHVSQQNTFTGRLTPQSFDGVLASVKRYLGVALVAAVTAVLVSFWSAPASAEVRPGSFESAALGRSVSYVVDLPPGYEASGSRRYPVVYALHGLFEGPGFWERRGLAPILAELRAGGAVPEFLVVAVDGGNSFFVNAPGGRYEDMLKRDLVAHVESSYRVVAVRKGRALLGVSMGGYAALHIAFDEPGLVAAVATHSAMLLERIPSAEQGAGRWHMAAFNKVFGDPIDAALWSENDPLVQARKVDPKAVPALFVDCGAEDRYGLAEGHRELHRILDERGIAHVFELPPGDHGYEFVRAQLAKSLRFLGDHLR
jgi:uracil-DNA glycosylase family 4